MRREILSMLHHGVGFSWIPFFLMMALIESRGLAMFFGVLGLILFTMGCGYYIGYNARSK